MNRKRIQGESFEEYKKASKEENKKIKPKVFWQSRKIIVEDLPEGSTKQQPPRNKVVGNTYNVGKNEAKRKNKEIHKQWN